MEGPGGLKDAARICSVPRPRLASLAGKRCAARSMAQPKGQPGPWAALKRCEKGGLEMRTSPVQGCKGQGPPPAAAEASVEAPSGSPAPRKSKRTGGGSLYDEVPWGEKDEEPSLLRLGQLVHGPSLFEFRASEKQRRQETWPAIYRCLRQITEQEHASQRRECTPRLLKSLFFRGQAGVFSFSLLSRCHPLGFTWRRDAASKPSKPPRASEV